jgi:hypothetical protein
MELRPQARAEMEFRHEKTAPFGPVILQNAQSESRSASLQPSACLLIGMCETFDVDSSRRAVKFLARMSEIHRLTPFSQWSISLTDYATQGGSNMGLDRGKISKVTLELKARFIPPI